MAYNNYKQANMAQAKLQGGISAASLSLIVEAGFGNLFPSTFPFLAILEQYDTAINNFRVLKREEIKVTNRVGDTFTIVRSAGSVPADYSATTQTTTAFSFSAGDTISQVYTTEQMKDVQDEVTRLETDKLNKSGGTLTGQLKGAKGVNLASAATVTLDSATGNFVHITGTTTITSFGANTAGTQVSVVFDGALILTHNGTSLILPGSANITTAAGDSAIFEGEGGSNWKCISYTKTNGQAVNAAADVNGLTANNKYNKNDYKLKYDALASANRKQLADVVPCGGTGADGALTISSGTTGLTLVNNYIEKNYSSITISGTAILDITGATGNGGIAYIKCAGDFTMSAGNIRMDGQGAAGAVSNTAASQASGTSGTQGNDLVFSLTSNLGNGGGGYQTGTAGASGAAITKPMPLSRMGMRMHGFCGAGGGSGGRSYNASYPANGVGGAGGAGGGVLIIEVGGTINHTGGTISANGTAGAAGIIGQSGYCGSGAGGGGGGGGTIIILYNSLTSVAGTVQVNGGAGGVGGGAMGGAAIQSGGGGGGSGITAGGAGGLGTNSNGASGAAGTSSTWGTGGAAGTGAGANGGSGGGGGGAGFKVITQISSY